MRCHGRAPRLPRVWIGTIVSPSPLILRQMPLSTDNHFPLRDGRVVGVAECGDPAGLPVFYCHGLLSSRLEIAAAPIVAAAERVGVRLIAMDRPGIGESSTKLHRTILDWTLDLADLAGGLGHERFAVLGVSGGAPYAIAAALRVPERLRAVGAVAGLAPLGASGLLGLMAPRARRMLRAGRWLPRLLDRPLAKLADDLARSPETVASRYERELPDADRAVLAEPVWREAFTAAWREAFRRGIEGPKQDLTLAARSWGYRLTDVRVPVNLWFGGADRIVPPAMARFLADRLRLTESRSYPTEGHLSLIAHRAESILADLVRATSRGRAAVSPA